MILGDRIAIGALGSAVVALALGAWLVLAPPTGDAGSHAVVDPLAALPSGSAAPHVGGTLVIDVEGGVKRPGIVQLPAGSRVADAIAAGGGYSPAADLAAAAMGRSARRRSEASLTPCPARYNRRASGPLT